MDGFRVATAYVLVEPDTDGFDSALQAKLEDMDPVIRVRTTVDPGDLAEQAQAAADETDAVARVRTTVDPADLAEQVQGAADETGAQARVGLEPDAAGWPEKLQGAVDTEGAEAQVPLAPDAADWPEKLQGAVDESHARADVPVHPDARGFGPELEAELLGSAHLVAPVSTVIDPVTGGRLQAMIDDASDGAAVHVGVEPAPGAAAELGDSVRALAEDAGEGIYAHVGVEPAPDSAASLDDKVRAIAEDAGQGAEVRVGLGLDPGSAERLRAEAAGAAGGAASAGGAESGGGLSAEEVLGLNAPAVAADAAAVRDLTEAVSAYDDSAEARTRSLAAPLAAVPGIEELTSRLQGVSAAAQRVRQDLASALEGTAAPAAMRDLGEAADVLGERLAEDSARTLDVGDALVTLRSAGESVAQVLGSDAAALERYAAAATTAEGGSGDFSLALRRAGAAGDQAQASVSDLGSATTALGETLLEGGADATEMGQALDLLKSRAGGAAGDIAAYSAALAEAAEATAGTDEAAAELGGVLGLLGDKAERASASLAAVAESNAALDESAASSIPMLLAEKTALDGLSSDIDALGRLRMARPVTTLGGGDVLGADSGELGAEAAELENVAGATEHVGAAASHAGASMHPLMLATNLLTKIPAEAWVLAFVAGLGVMAYEFSKTGTMADDYTSALQRQYGATKDNVAGFDSYAASMQHGGAAAAALTRQLQQVTITQARFGIAAGESAQQVSQVSQASMQAAQQAAQVTRAVFDMAGQLRVTGPMAQRLAYDESQIGSNAANAKGQVAAFSNEIKLLTGNLNANWGLQLGVAQGMLSVAVNAKAAGASMTGTNQASLTLQESFQQQIGTIDAYGQHQQTAGKMTQATSDYLTLQTSKLALLAGGSQMAQAQVEGQISQEILWGARTRDVNIATDNLARSIGGAFVSSLHLSSGAASEVSGAVARLSTSILDSGTASAATRGDRAALIADLEAVGVKASVARTIVRELEAELARLHGKNINIGVHVETSSSGPVSVPGGISGTTARFAAASGMRVPGYGGGDIVPALLEPGETVVSKEDSRGLAPAFRAIGVPGYADGGAVPAGRSSFAWPQDVFNFAVGPFNQGSGVWDGGGSLAAGLKTYAGESAAEKARRLKDMETAGAALAKAFAGGSLTTVAEIRDESRKAIDDLKKYYSGPAAARLEATIGRQATAMEKLATASAKVSATIAGMKAFSAQEVSSLQGFSNISNITGTTNAATGVTAPVTGTQIQAGLREDLAQLRQFEAIIKELKRKKVASGLIEQVIALGPVAGIQYGQAILSGGSSLIAEINKTEKAISGEETVIGHTSAEIQFGQSIGKGFLSGLDKQEAAIDRKMLSYGDEIARELAKALGVPEKTLEKDEKEGRKKLASEVHKKSVPHKMTPPHIIEPTGGKMHPDVHVTINLNGSKGKLSPEEISAIKHEISAQLALSH